MVQKVLKFTRKGFQHVVYARESEVNLRVPQEGVRGGSEGGPRGGVPEGGLQGVQIGCFTAKNRGQSVFFG